MTRRDVTVMKLHLGKFTSLVRLLGPVVLAAVPGGEKIAPHVTTVLDAIADAEQMKGASGAEKKARALAIVAKGVATANATGKVKLDVSEVQAIAAHGIDAVVGAVTVVGSAGVPPPASAAELGVHTGSTGE